jgi:flagellar capping protein FliD
MGELRFPGLATGIDTGALIQQLMITNSRRLAKYQVQKTEFQAQDTALEELRTKVTALQSAAAKLSDADTLDALGATSSDTDVMTLATTSQAEVGSHSVDIKQLATTETWIQDVSTFEHEDDYVGTGNFIYSYNNKEVVVTTTAGETTLLDLVTKINNEKSGVTASLLNQGGKYHLMLSGQETGGDYRISVNESSTEVHTANTALTLRSDTSQNAGLMTKITELAQFLPDGDALEGTEQIQITGTDHFGKAITAFDLDIGDQTTMEYVIDAIEDAYDGNVRATLEDGKIVVTDITSGVSQLTVDIAYVANGSAATLTLPADTDFSVTEGGDVVNANALLDPDTFIQTQQAQNSQIRIDDYIPADAGSEIQTITPTPNPSTPGDTYTLTYMGKTTDDIAYDATYAEIQAELEKLSSVNDGDITVGPETVGTNGLADGGVKFTFSDTLGDVPSILVDTTGLTGVTVTVAETTKGVSEYTNRNSNSVSDVLTGITFNLQDVTPDGECVEITVNRNLSAVSGKVSALVSAYNAMITEIEAKTEYNAAEKKMGILSRDVAASFIESQAQNLFIGITDGFLAADDTYTQASDIGITLDGANRMKFDSEVFTDAINEDYTAVLDLLGVTATGSSNTDKIEFNDASDKHTTPGTYDVEVIVAGGIITSAKISSDGGTTWRDATQTGSTNITGNGLFDEETGKAVFPENGLNLEIDISTDTTLTATIQVKKGIAGNLEDMLEAMLEGDGRFDGSKGIIDDKVTAMSRRIELEEARLERVQTRLISKYARLERMLSEINSQMGAAGMLNGGF